LLRSSPFEKNGGLNPSKDWRLYHVSLREYLIVFWMAVYTVQILGYITEAKSRKWCTFNAREYYECIWGRKQARNWKASLIVITGKVYVYITRLVYQSILANIFVPVYSASGCIVQIDGILGFTLLPPSIKVDQLYLVFG
jgi:hypothetical protein